MTFVGIFMVFFSYHSLFARLSGKIPATNVAYGILIFFILANTWMIVDCVSKIINWNVFFDGPEN